MTTQETDSPSEKQDVRPVVITLAVTGLALLGLVAALRYGWLGADVGRGSEFCERWHAGCIKQPANTLSNLGFIVAGLAIAWRARHLQARGEGPLRSAIVVTWLASTVALLGPGSAAMHATGTELGGALDLLSMHLIAAFAAGYAMARRRSAVGKSSRFVPYFVLFLLFAQSAVLVEGTVPVVKQPENITFGLLLILVGVIEALPVHTSAGTVRTRPDRRWLVAAIVALVVAFVIWNLAQGPWCDPDSWIQGHAAWHLLCALAAWLLFRFYASERSVA